MQYFKIYRGTDPGFIPAPGNLVHATTDNLWTDPVYDGWDVHYKVTAVDDSGNEGDAASPGTTTAVTEPKIQKTVTLYQNAPNPFNPTTVIRYDIPATGGQVTLMIFDVNGQLIRKLVEGNVTPGVKSAIWDGTDYQANPVSSGVYFYCLKAGGKTLTKKMVILK